MPIHLNNKTYSFYPVPKCISTSAKEMFFHYENGFPFDQIKTNGTPLGLSSVHYFYPMKKFRAPTRKGSDKTWSVSIIRDPITRVLSAYGNRVIAGKGIKPDELTEEDRKAGMSTEPDLQNFVKFLREYRSRSQNVRTHLGPLKWHLGDDAGFYDRLYTVRQVKEFLSDAEERLGTLPPLAHRMNAGPKFKPSDLTNKERRKIETVFAEDYRIFGKHFEEMVDA